jgi:hypothetical protein
MNFLIFNSLSFIFLSFHQAFFETLSGIGVVCFTTGRRKFSLKILPFSNFGLNMKLSEKSAELCLKLTTFWRDWSETYAFSDKKSKTDEYDFTTASHLGCN